MARRLRPDGGRRRPSARRQRPDGAEAAPRWQKAAPGGAEAAPDGEGGCYVGFAMRTLHISLILFEIHEHLTRFA